MAEIVPVVSEALEAQVRDLLPSQRGFGEDLQASNVITPVIDLTAAAQGTTTPEYLQTALAYGSQTAFLLNNASNTSLVSTAGFYRIYGISTVSGTNAGTNFTLSDGTVATKRIWNLVTGATATQLTASFDFVIFLRFLF